MGNVNGQKNKGGGTWTEEERLHGNIDSRRGRDARHESQFTGSESKRAYREDRQKSSFFSSGAPAIGGIFDELIDEYRDQLVAKKEEIRLAEEKARHLKNEIDHIESRIEEFESIKEDLKKKPEDNP